MSHQLKMETCGTTTWGDPILRVILDSGDLRLSVLNLGAVIESIDWLNGIRTAASLGRSSPLSLGYPRPEDYEADPYYCGSFVGRTAGRIGSASYILDGITHRLSANWKGRHHLHGGVRGFSHRIWNVVETAAGSVPSVELHLVSSAGEEGHPGRLEVSLTYTLRNKTLEILAKARTDAATHVNLTSHVYLNLSGRPLKVVDDHVLLIRSRSLLICDDELIPTGELCRFSDCKQPHDLDFQEPRALGATVLDHSYVIDPAGQRPGSMREAASLIAPDTGIGCHVRTNQPVINIYTGDYLGASSASGILGRRMGICLEAQHAPDACHHPQFASTRLLPGQEHVHSTQYNFFETSTQATD